MCPLWLVTTHFPIRYDDGMESDPSHWKSHFDQTEFIQTTSLIETELTLTSFKRLQDEDQSISKIKDQTQLPSEYFLKNGILMRYGKDRQIQIVVPSSLQQFLIQKYHGGMMSGHAGTRKVLRTMEQYYYWTNMEKDIRELIRNCMICQYAKPTNYGALPPSETITPTRPNQIIAIDCVTGLPMSKEGHTVILTIVDHFSKFSIAVPLKSKSSKGYL